MGEAFRIDRVRGRSVARNSGPDQSPTQHELVDPDIVRWIADPVRAQRTVIEAPAAADSRYEDPNPALDGDLIETAPGSAWPDDMPLDMAQKLATGEYHVGTILESFGVRWPLDKCARDVWQNFFDANDYSLTGLHPSIVEHDGVYTITIEGQGVYDPRKLLHIGGTGKQEDARAAGGFGEGTAVSSFVLLRDFNVDSVHFESIGWALEFDLKQGQSGSSTERERGLFATLRPLAEREDGNNIVITTRDPKVVDAIIQARELFYYEGHPDFTDPLFENDFGGIKLVMESKSRFVDPTGRLYDACQRRHYEDGNDWSKLEWMNFWTKQKMLPPDRDRGKATSREVQEHMINPFAESLSLAEAEALLLKLEPLWDKGSTYQPAIHLVEKLCQKLEVAKRTIQFPDNCVAVNVFNSRISDIMRGSGHRLCHNALAKVGMKLQSERWQELQSHFRVEAQPEQVRRIVLLQQAAALVGKRAKEIWLFESTSMNDVLRGQYGGEQHVWLTDKEVSEQPFAQAVSTYLHELDHEHGNDGSPQFTDALTQTLATVIQSQVEKPTEWQALAGQW
jgi:hypothetical protein